MECKVCFNFYKELNNHVCNKCTEKNFNYTPEDFESIKQTIKDTNTEYSNLKNMIDDYEGQYKYNKRKLFILEKNIEYKRIELLKKQDEINMYTKILIDITTSLVDS